MLQLRPEIVKECIDEFKKMEFKAGVVEGEFYDQDGIQKIANIPSREVLVAKFMGSIQSPVGKFVRTLAAISEAKAEGVVQRLLLNNSAQRYTSEIDLKGS
ncbi:hypothetical protein [Eubacterium sp. AB3007]|uniref:hypothetical protein n=1 Tax=Eubacterium sp. AB3007 TaxID=1392487 RepID=UPI000ABD154B|nr:hypothetical protein [Eubacterium sp. AB3007]